MNKSIALNSKFDIEITNWKLISYKFGIKIYNTGYGYVLFNATFNNISDISFYWWRKSEYPEKTSDLPYATDKFIT